MAGAILWKGFWFSAHLLSVFQVLQFDEDDLCNSLKFCSKGEPFIGRKYDEPEERDDLVRELWPNCPALQISAQVEEVEQLLQNIGFS